MFIAIPGVVGPLVTAFGRFIVQQGVFEVIDEIGHKLLAKYPFMQRHIAAEEAAAAAKKPIVRAAIKEVIEPVVVDAPVEEIESFKKDWNEQNNAELDGWHTPIVTIEKPVAEEPVAEEPVAEEPQEAPIEVPAEYPQIKKPVIKRKKKA
jgi:hypothetical protein